MSAARTNSANLAPLLVVGLSLVLSGSAGCSQKPYELAPVSGTVTLDGEPLAGAAVNFQPVRSRGNDNPGPGSSGRCDGDGRYQLTTIHGDPGAVVGQHRIRIYSDRQPVDSSRDESGPAPRDLMPDRYNTRTELTLDVTPDGTSQADFSLTSGPAAR